MRMNIDVSDHEMSGLLSDHRVSLNDVVRPSGL